MEPHTIVSQAEWLEARKALLAEERAFTHARDALVAKRQALPWVKVEKTYTFETPQGSRTLPWPGAGSSCASGESLTGHPLLFSSLPASSASCFLSHPSGWAG